MKTLIVRAAAVLGLLLAAGAAEAQYQTFKPRESLFIFNYEMSWGVGDLHDFIDATSFRGFSFEARSFVKPQFSAGVGVTYNRFDQTHSLLTISQGPGGTLSGPVYRYMDQLAIKGLFHYYLGEHPVLKPYLGVGLGGAWHYSYSQTADLAKADDGFDFIASPEAGILLTAAKGTSSVGLNLAFRYNYTTADFQGVKDAQTVNLVIGIFGAY